MIKRLFRLLLILIISLTIPSIVNAGITFQDKFERADSETVGGAWTEVLANFRIAGNNLNATSAARGKVTAANNSHGFICYQYNNTASFADGLLHEWETGKAKTLYGYWENDTQFVYFDGAGYVNCGDDYIIQKNDWFCYTNNTPYTVQIGQNSSLMTQLCNISTTYDRADADFTIGIDSGANGINVNVAIDEVCGSSSLADCTDQDENVTTPDTAPPVISNLNMTSCGQDTSSPYDITCEDRTPSWSFDTDETAECFMSTTNQSFDDMSGGCSVTNSTTHSCTQPTDLSEGQYYQYFACNDASGNNHTTTNSTQALSELHIYPIVTLNNPTDSTILTGLSNVTFNGSAIENDGILENATLIINGLFNQTNTSALSNNTNYSFIAQTLPKGQYNWSILFCDNFTNCNQTANFTLDINSPNITLNSPANLTYYYFGEDEVIFLYTPYIGDDTISNCSLLTNESGSFIINQTNTNDSDSTQNRFNQTYPDVGIVEWGIQCDTVEQGIILSSNLSINISNLLVNDTVNITWCNSMSSFIVKPANGTDTNVEPLNQSDNNCTFSVHNNLTNNITFRLALSRLIGGFATLLFDDFNTIDNDTWITHNSSVIINNTIGTNFSKPCMWIRNAPLNTTAVLPDQGYFSGQIIYFHNNTRNDSYLNQSNLSQTLSVVNTYDCISPVDFVSYNISGNRSNENNTYANLSNYNITYIHYILGDPRTNNTNATVNFSTGKSFWIELRDYADKSINSSQVVPNSTVWNKLNLSLDQSGFTKSNVSVFKIHLNASNTSDTFDQFILIIDQFLVNATEREAYIDWKVNGESYSNTSTTTLTTEYQDIMNITINATENLSFFFDYNNPTIGDRLNLSTLIYQLAGID